MSGTELRNYLVLTTLQGDPSGLETRFILPQYKLHILILFFQCQQKVVFDQMNHPVEKIQAIL